jgi:uncharacterized protein (DUF2062 family)
VSAGRRLGARLRALLHLDDPPPRLALGLAVGVVISCTPFLGVQTLLGLLVAWAFGLHRAAVVTGVWLNLPWFAPAVYGVALAVGHRLVPGAHDDSWLARVRQLAGPLPGSDLWALFRELSLALLVGSTVVGLVAGALTYGVALAVLRARGRRPRV